MAGRLCLGLFDGQLGCGQARGGADLSPMRAAGMPVLSLRQDATRYFDIHHTVNDTLLQVDRKELDQNVAAYVVAAYLAAESTASFGPLPPEPPR